MSLIRSVAAAALLDDANCPISVSFITGEAQSGYELRTSQVCLPPQIDWSSVTRKINIHTCELVSTPPNTRTAAITMSKVTHRLSTATTLLRVIALDGTTRGFRKLKTRRQQCGDSMADAIIVAQVMRVLGTLS